MRLGMLEAEGRISRQHGRGTFATDARHASQNLVRELSRLTNPIDTMEARLAIEPQQARLAALRATNGDIDRLFEAADASRDAKDPLSYEKADAAFHRRVAAASRNPMLIAVFDAVLQTALDGTWRHGRETAHCINNQAAYAADHRKIAVAIAERNAAQAEAAMRLHLNAVQKRLIEHAFPTRTRRNSRREGGQQFLPKLPVALQMPFAAHRLLARIEALGMQQHPHPAARRAGALPGIVLRETAIEIERPADIGDRPARRFGAEDIDEGHGGAD